MTCDQCGIKEATIRVVHTDRMSLRVGDVTAMVLCGNECKEKNKHWAKGATVSPICNEFVECGCCSYMHPKDFYGDCRDDENRFCMDDLDRIYGSTGWIDVTFTRA